MRALAMLELFLEPVAVEVVWVPWNIGHQLASIIKCFINWVVT